MTENADIRLIENATDNTAENISFEIDIFQQPLSISIVFEQKQAGLADIVPLAQQISKKITDLLIENEKQQGAVVPCNKGCAACCNYLVPVSVPQMIKVIQTILSLPQNYRKDILRRWLLSARQVLKHKPPKLFSAQATMDITDSVQTGVISNWYQNLQQPCPFIYKKECIIYQDRPLACREHFVVGSASPCKGICGEPQTLHIPLSMANVLAQLAAELEGTEVQAVMLPLGLAWFEENLYRVERTWPAEEMVERFVQIVKQTTVLSEALTRISHNL